LLGRAWQRDAGGELRIDRCLVDSGFETPTVYEFCARSPFASILMPSKGLGVLAGSMPITEYKAKPGQRAPGFHTIVSWDPRKRLGRLLTIDTNFFKTFAANRISTLGPG
jgi:hypothetical protein